MTVTKNKWIKRGERPLLPGETNSPNVITDSQDNPGEIRAFRGTTTLAYPIGQIAKAVCEPKDRLNWVERMSEDILIKGNPEDGEWLSYEAYQLIWPISDRDYVFKQNVQTTSCEGKKRTVVNVVSIEHPEYPEKPKRVRGTLTSCSFTLNEINNNKTHIEVIVQVDPEGRLPRFLKNIIQKGWAIKTLRALNKYLGENKN